MVGRDRAGRTISAGMVLAEILVVVIPFRFPLVFDVAAAATCRRSSSPRCSSRASVPPLRTERLKVIDALRYE